MYHITADKTQICYALIIHNTFQCCCYGVLKIILLSASKFLSSLPATPTSRKNGVHNTIYLTKKYLKLSLLSVQRPPLPSKGYMSQISVSDSMRCLFVFHANQAVKEHL